MTARPDAKPAHAEPWVMTGPNSASDSQGAPLLEGYGPALRHAVACVNACAGLDPAALPALIEAAERADRALDAYIKECAFAQASSPALDALLKLRAALANVRGAR